MNHLLLTAMRELNAWLEAQAKTVKESSPTFACSCTNSANSPTGYTWTALVVYRNEQNHQEAKIYEAEGCTMQEATLNMLANIKASE